MDRLSKDSPFQVLAGQVQTNIRDANHIILAQYFSTFLTNVLPQLRPFMTERQVEITAKDLWLNFVKDYKPRSSKGFLMIGKRKTDADQTYFYYERTHDKDPSKRISEWKDRLMISSKECADTIFGELFSQALLGSIRTHRTRSAETITEKNKDKEEVEWFKMDNLTWLDIMHIQNEVCLFVQTIKSTKVITLVDINSASESQLKTLPEVGPKIAARMIAKRTEKLFTGFDDLKKRVHKLGERKINAFREFVTFGNLINQNNENLSINVNVNTASADDLKELPKIGDELAKRIVDYRNTRPFAKKENLLDIRGIGPKTFDLIKDLITTI